MEAGLKSNLVHVIYARALVHVTYAPALVHVIYARAQERGKASPEEGTVASSALSTEIGKLTARVQLYQR